MLALRGTLSIIVSSSPSEMSSATQQSSELSLSGRNRTPVAPSRRLSMTAIATSPRQRVATAVHIYNALLDGVLSSSQCDDTNKASDLFSRITRGRPYATLHDLSEVLSMFHPISIADTARLLACHADPRFPNQPALSEAEFIHIGPLLESYARNALAFAELHVKDQAFIIKEKLAAGETLTSYEAAARNRWHAAALSRRHGETPQQVFGADLSKTHNVLSSSFRTTGRSNDWSRTLTRPPSQTPQKSAALRRRLQVSKNPTSARLPHTEYYRKRGPLDIPEVRSAPRDPLLQARREQDRELVATLQRLMEV